MIYLIIPIVMFLALGGAAALSTRGASKTYGEEVKPTGCLIGLANLLLRPIPVIFAYYQFGFLIAVAVALALWLISRCFDLYKGKLWSGITPTQFVLPVCAGLTLFTGNFTYFQLAPSGLCLVLVLQQLDGFIRKKTDLFPGDDSVFFTNEDTKLARWGMIGAGLIALIVSEYFRRTLSLSGWIWYFGYLRIELLPIFLGGIAPAIMRAMNRADSGKGEH